jgi:hypothetical protein
MSVFLLAVGLWLLTEKGCAQQTVALAYVNAELAPILPNESNTF